MHTHTLTPAIYLIAQTFKVKTHSDITINGIVIFIQRKMALFSIIY